MERTLLYVYDEELRIVGGFDDYKSLIWARRYRENGDCEIYAPASAEAIELLKIGRFVRRIGDDMVCLIQSVEITSSATEGDYITVTGKDAACLLDRRIVWRTTTCYGNAEKFLLKLANEALGAAAEDFRQYKSDGGELLFTVADPSGLVSSLSLQVSYKQVGDVIRENCQRFGWGYRVQLSGGVLLFSVYAGEDRSASVQFSDDLENLITSDYLHDETNSQNVALVAGEGEGAARQKQYLGDATGKDRFEIYVDARDLSKKITFGQLVAAYPRTPEGAGYVDIIDGAWVYRLTSLDVPILSEAQRAQLAEEYPDGREVTVDGQKFWRVRDVVAADIPSERPESDDEIVLRDIIYDMYLGARGVEKLSAYGVETRFDGTVEPETTFIYGKDYFLGDIVTVKNHYGITAKVRITEVVEVLDDNGYSVQPRFEHLEVL